MVVRDRILKSVGLSWLIMYRESSPLLALSTIVSSCRLVQIPLVFRQQCSVCLDLVRSYHAVSAEMSVICYMCSTRSYRPYAIIFTCFPLAFAAMRSASFADLASMLPLGGTAATMTSMPLRASASVIPRQYCRPGIYCPASRSSSKPRSP